MRIPLLILTTSLIVAPLKAADVPRAVLDALPSVAMLVLKDADGNPKALGSGFFIKPNIIATSFDLMTDVKSGNAILAGRDHTYDIKGAVASDKKNNIVLLSVEDAPAQPLQLADDSKIKFGYKIYALGNPKGTEGTVEAGKVKGLHEKGQDKFFQVTSTINPGSNGGPVVNEEGRVIGVGQSFFSGGRLFSIAVPSSFVAALDAKEKGLAAFNIGKVSPDDRPKLLAKSAKEIIECDNVIWAANYAASSKGNFSFSVRNKSSKTLKNIVMNVVFHDSSGKAVESVIASSAAPLRKNKKDNGDNLLRPKSAIRISGKADEATHMISEDLSSRTRSGKSRPKHKVTFEVLSFEIVEGGKGRFDPANPFKN